MKIKSKRKKLWIGIFAAALLVAMTVSQLFAQNPNDVEVDWGRVQEVSKTTPTLQVVVNPPLRRGSKIHDKVFQELEDPGADYVRYMPWLPYPKLAVAELKPHVAGESPARLSSPSGTRRAEFVPT